MLYVKNEIGAIHRTDLESNDTEFIWVELRPGNKKIEILYKLKLKWILAIHEPTISQKIAFFSYRHDQIEWRLLEVSLKSTQSD